MIQRKRSRPSDWWAVSQITSTPPQHKQESHSRRKHARTLVDKSAGDLLEARNSYSASARISRKGKAGKEQEKSKGEFESEGGKAEVIKSLRRRPSNAERLHNSNIEIIGISKTSLGKNSPAAGPILPRKRGKLNVSQSSKPILDTVSARDPKSLRNGRSSNAQAVPQETLVSSPNRPALRERNKRPSTNSTKLPKQKKKTRPPKAPLKGKQIQEPIAEVEAESASSSLSRNRTSRSGIMPTAAVECKSALSAEEPQIPKKRGPPLTSEVSGQPASRAPKSKKNSQLPPLRRKESQETKQEVQFQPSKRRRIDKDQNEAEHGELERVPAYQHLAAVTRKVSRHSIEAKWESLPPACIERISQLLQDTQKPVVVRHGNDRHRIQASTALQMISRKLVSKVSKGLPFPVEARQQRENVFDFEKILDHNRSLEALLTPALHANELLEAELEKEILWLESEKANLAELEANAKLESSRRKHESRKMHLLLHSSNTISAKEGLADEIGLDVNRPSGSPLHHIQDDKNLKDLWKELRGHIESMDSNIKQVQDVGQAIASSKAAVQAKLFDLLDSTHYEDVVLG